jgi:hypothetical protein
VTDAPLFPQPRRRVGQSEALLAKTLAAWHRDGYLAGDAWSAARGVLRDCARAVDAARDDMRAGEGSAYSFARTVKIYADLLALYRTGDEGVSHDGIDALLASISGPPVRDTPQP